MRTNLLKPFHPYHTNKVMEFGVVLATAPVKFVASFMDTWNSVMFPERSKQ